jgi:hypothetical protein
MKWVANLNDYSEYFYFIVNGDKLWAMHNDIVSKVRTLVSRLFSNFNFIGEVRLFK